MKSLNLLIVFIFLLPIFIYSQTLENDWQCGVALDTTFYQTTESITPIIDDSLKVGLLLVQFADWDNNYDAKGGVWIFGIA